MTFYVNDRGGNGVEPGAANVDSREIAKFEALAHRWWDPDGDFKPLHDINPVRVGYIAGRCTIAGRPVIDVGCGGGILTESLAGLGADVTGIDMAEGPLTVAKLHAFETGCTDVRYELATPEAFADVEPEHFELVTCLEMLEHVPDIQSTIDALAKLAAPGGHIVLSTINRHPKAYALAVIGDLDLHSRRDNRIGLDQDVRQMLLIPNRSFAAMVLINPNSSPLVRSSS